MKIINTKKKNFGKKSKKMKIILSAHFDLAKPVKYIKLDKNNMNGLVDNFAGVFASYQASRKTGVDLYLTNSEEVNLGGAISVAKKIKNEKILVIVVDTCTNIEKGKDAYIGNAYNFSTDELKNKFSKIIHFRDGYFEPTEDETAIYGDDNNIPCFFFGIPIDKNYHDLNNQISHDKIDKSSDVLADVINFLDKKA